jgi:hypothetical protein
MLYFEIRSNIHLVVAPLNSPSQAVSRTAARGSTLPNLLSCDRSVCGRPMMFTPQEKVHRVLLLARHNSVVGVNISGDHTLKINSDVSNLWQPAVPNTV